MGPVDVSFMSPLAAPSERPRLRTPALKVSSRAAAVPPSSSAGIVCPISIKYGGKCMCLSASPQTVITPSHTIASTEYSGPSMYSSTIARPEREKAIASSSAAASSVPLSAFLQPLPPMLSTGFTTTGYENGRLGGFPS